MALYIAAPLALVVLQLPASCPKCIAQRDIGVFVSVIRRMSVPDRDLFVGQRDVDAEVVQEALVLVMSGRLHDDMAARDVLAEPVEPRGELANTGLESRGGVHVTKGDLQRKYHGQFLESAVWELGHCPLWDAMRINADGARRLLRHEISPSSKITPSRSLIMDIGTICKRNVVTVREADELVAAAQLMREKHVGYLIVVKPSIVDVTVTPVGVITDRDIVVAVVAKETDPRTLKVGDVMTRQPAVVEEGSSVSTALQLMRRIGVRRVPVIGRAGMLVGVLSLDDVLDAIAGELMDIASSIRHEIRMEDALRP